MLASRVTAPGAYSLTKEQESEKWQLLALSSDQVKQLSPRRRRRLGRYKHQQRNDHRDAIGSQAPSIACSTLPTSNPSSDSSLSPPKTQRSNAEGKQPTYLDTDVDKQFAIEQQAILNRSSTPDQRKRSSGSPSSTALPAKKRPSLRKGEGSSRTASITKPTLFSLSTSLNTITVSPREPDWYIATPVPNTRGFAAGVAAYSSTIDYNFSQLRAAITSCEDAARSGQSLNIGLLNERLHKAFFIDFVDERAAKAAIRKNRLLHNDSGLPRLFREDISYPFHIIADAKELYTKWWLGIFDTSLYRGIIIGTKKNEKINRAGGANKLDPNYRDRIEGKFHGNQHLLNGQWWPNQICALRDGAHNSSQGGIAGSMKDGAWSIILAGDTDYPDIDEGDMIEYCGTEGTQSHPSTQTQYMKNSLNNGQPVRVIRSENCKNPIYRPAKGYRYDGLYEVVGEELVNTAKQLWRFKMRRLPDQDPIRFQGPEVRPTPEELDKLQKSRVEREFLVAGRG